MNTQVYRTTQGTMLTDEEFDLANTLLTTKEWIDGHGSGDVESFSGSVWLYRTNGHTRVKRAVVTLNGDSYCSINGLRLDMGIPHLSTSSIGPTVSSVPAAVAAKGWSLEGLPPGQFCILEYIGEVQ